MDKKSTFLQDNLIFLLIPVLVFAAGVYFSIQKVNLMLETRSSVETKKVEKETKETKYNQLKLAKAKQENKEVEKKTAKSGKVIYEVLGQQFSAEASFGIMFENVLSNITGNGVRIRSIEVILSCKISSKALLKKII